MKNRHFTPDKLITYLLFYRIIFSFLAEYVIANLTRLGDVNLYLNSRPAQMFQEYGHRVFTDWVLLPRLVVGTVSSVLQVRVLVHVVFACLAWYGIRTLLKAAKTANTKMYTFLILLCFSPSFTVWSSTASKEALVVFSMGIVCAQIIKFFKGEPVKFSVPLIFAVWFICVIKFYYIPFLVLSIVYIFVRQRITLSWKTELVLLIIMVLCMFGAFYLCRYKIDTYTLNKLHTIYRSTARSTRAPVFTEHFDFIRKMPYLMPLSMWGPSLAELGKSVLHKATFVENCFLLLSFVYLLRKAPVYIFRKFSVYYQWLIFGFAAVVLLLFAQYIQGVMNPGAAIRYRTNIYIPLLTFAYAFTCVGEREKNEKQD